ncbi:MAG: hypothetical protein FWB83_10765, partial [Treponema sp.]|nr:hypothetical protein [Treponema sp.]
MIEQLNAILGFNIPLWAYIACLAVLIALVIFLIWFIQTRMFKSRLRKIIDAKEEIQLQEAIK